MKKLIAFIIATLALVATLTACTAPHTHTYSEKWSADLDYHWHYCEHEKCTEQSDKSPHEWDEGVIAAEPTPSIPGLKKYTCTVCGAIESVPYEYTGE